MQLIDGQPVYSATDLVGFLACEHLTELEKAAANGLTNRPDRPDPELDLIRKRGFEHEQRYLADLERAGRHAIRIELDGFIEDRADQLRAAAAETTEAIRRGDDVIYQATFFDGTWRGHADFLLRIDTPGDPSALGEWSYEVADTKLARHTKASALLQICSYVDQLARIQGRLPERMHVALGGSARQVETFRVADFMAYYRMAKRLFEDAVEATEPAYPPQNTYPDPVEHCDVCRWDPVCSARRRADDDLALVAGITARQRRALKGLGMGVGTRRALAAAPLPPAPPLGNLEGASPESLARVREQARVQVAGEDARRPVHELIEPARTKDGQLEPNRGLLSLPEPRPGDLFFDIEGDPFANDDGLDYLFGVLDPGRKAEEGNTTFHAFWARDADGKVTPEAEKQAFERTIDLFIDRLDRDPTIHIYHYAAYEPTALGRLMGRYGTREGEIDRLLRGDVLVDLFRAVRQGVRASVESYSIKRLEPFYGFEREVDLRDAGSSIVAFEAWLETGGEDGHDEETLRRIERYNRDDVVSTLLLRDWLETLRPELERTIGEPLPRLQPKDGRPTEELTAALVEVQALVDRLTAGVPADAAARTQEQHARLLLAQLLGWHRREDKSAWWRFFHLIGDLTDEDRLAEPDAIAGLEYLGVDRVEGRSNVHRYRFPPQEHDVAAGTDVRDPATVTDENPIGRSPGTVVSVDNVAGILELKRGIGSDAPHPTSLVPYTIVQTTEQRASLMRVGEWVADHGIDSGGDRAPGEPDAPEAAGEPGVPGPYRAALDLLLRRPPSVGQAPGSNLLLPGEHARDAARRLVLELARARGGFLAIQGPPGSGKTTVGASMIVDLVAAGRRVGVTANSHKVIGLLLSKVAAEARTRGLPVRLGQKPATGEAPTCADARPFTDNAGLRAALANGGIDVAGATAWAWSREDFAGSVDVLFVDEAGQLSLANAIAVSPAARSLVLLGDPQQLDQPVGGSHPPGAERSALAHLLDGGPRPLEPARATMPGELGLFLDGTWRLHPDICAYTSEVFYEGRLEPEPGRDRQTVGGAGVLDGAGIRFVSVLHEGNRNESDEEAAVLAGVVGELLARRPSPRWTDDKGDARPLGLGDVLVITPYNAQVRAIARAIDGVRVGTVDKFQGQEAPISVYSMATSSAAEAPRGMEFLYSLHRLNVATSRARCVAAVVASPELLRVRCRTPRQMQLANGLARLVEMAL